LDTDPVLGHYRPVEASPVSLDEVSGKIGDSFKELLEKEKDPKIASLLSSFAQKSGLSWIRKRCASRWRIENLIRSYALQT